MSVVAQTPADRRALSFAMTLSLVIGLLMFVLKVGAYLVWLGRRKHSIILVANGKQVLTDFWTSFAVLVGLGLVMLTKWLPFDPICGIIMGGNILFSGAGLLKSSFSGLMDQVDPATHETLRTILDRETAKRGLSYHDLRHRNLGDSHWVEVHFLFPDGTGLAEAHRQATAIERAVEESLEPRAHVTSHLECASDHDELQPPGHEISSGRGVSPS